MKLTKTILFGLMISARLLYAQSDFRPGYIVENSGDTLFGKIDYRGDIMMSKTCTFKKPDNTIIKYSPNDILEYRFKEGKYYISSIINGHSVFLEYLIKAKINMYYMRNDSGDHYYINKEGLKLTEIPYLEEIKHENDKQVYYQSTKHIGTLNYFMQDAPNFQDRIATIKKPNQQNLVKLGEDYQKSFYKESNSIVYEKKQTLFSVNPEIAGGISLYSPVNLHSGDTIKEFNQNLNIGLILHFWLPNENEKLFFRTGIMFSSFLANSVQIDYFKVPLSLEYIYPKGILRPKFAVGYNFIIPKDKNIFHTLGLMGGLVINMKNHIDLAIDYDVDFSTSETGMAPEKLFSQSILVGLYLKMR